MSRFPNPKRVEEIVLWDPQDEKWLGPTARAARICQQGNDALEVIFVHKDTLRENDCLHVGGVRTMSAGLRGFANVGYGCSILFGGKYRM